jgi:hypothetical protein
MAALIGTQMNSVSRTPLPGIVHGYDGQVGDRLDEDLEDQQPNEELNGPTHRSDIVAAFLAPEHDGCAEHSVIQD